MHRIGLILLLLALGMWPLEAQDVRLRLNRPDGVYSRGDTVMVYGRCEMADSPLVNCGDPGDSARWCGQCTSVADSLRMEVRVGGNTRSVAPLRLGPRDSVIYTEICDSSRWVAVLVSAGEKVIDVGYVVEPGEFRPGYAAPRDLGRFWKKEMARMRRRPMSVKVDSVAAPEKYAGQVTCWHIELSMHEGRPVNAYVSIPSGSAPGSLPIRIGTHGATDISSPSTRSSLNKACRHALKGAIGVDVNAHGIRDDAPEEYYLDLENGELKDYERQELKSRKDWYFRLMYLRLVRLVDYLVTVPEWNGRDITVIGHSQGGGQALALGGLDPRVTRVVADEPALTDLGGALLGRRSGWPYSRRKVDLPTTRLASRILPYYDAALLAGFFHGTLTVRVGLADYICPAPAVYSAFNTAGCRASLAGRHTSSVDQPSAGPSPADGRVSDPAPDTKSIIPFRSRHHVDVVWYDREEFEALPKE